MSLPKTGPRSYKCEWPTLCPSIAATNIRRGVHVKPLHLCSTHGRLFHDLTDREANDVTARRQPTRAQRY